VDLSLANKKILILGASSGIGKQCAKEVDDNGGHLFLASRNYDKLEQTNLGLSKKHHVLTVDIENESSIDAFVDTLDTKLDGVVLSAGVINYLPFKLISAELIDDVFNVNFKGQVLLLQKLIKKKKINKSASIVFISSISSKIGVPGTSLYAASKGAITSLVRVLAIEQAKLGVRVNSVSPGIVRTPMIDNNEAVSESQLALLEKKYPLGLGTTEDVANLCSFLLSNKSRWITGEDITIDGGASVA
jgi:NAD(P)-dependent dehydrogenase (short-subunit alcohol dehydrogenase family)